MSRPIDVGIITVVDAEFHGLLRVFGTTSFEKAKVAGHPSPLNYYRLEFQNGVNRRWCSAVVTFLPGKSGNIESAVTTGLFLRDWRPRLMVLVGIGAGAASRVGIGDVIVASRVHDRTIRFAEPRGGSTYFAPRSSSTNRSDQLNRMLKERPVSEKSVNDLLGKTHSSEAETPERPVRVRTDLAVVSDNVLIRDPELLRSWLENTDQDCVVGEMEAAGFVRSVVINGGIPWLVVRGVSDYGDPNKSDSHQKLAAFAAGTVLKVMLEESLDIDELPIPGVTLDQTASDSDLVSVVYAAFVQGRYLQVCSIGPLLSRALFLKGDYETRKRLGIWIEEASRRLGRKRERARALIDDIGWTSYLLGDGLGGKTHIEDGITLASSCRDKYLESKGHRHLASIARSIGDIESASRHLGFAVKSGNRIREPRAKQEMLASLQLSAARLLVKKADYEQAVRELTDALQSFSDLGDAEREVKVYADLGEAYSAMGNQSEAIAHFKRGIERAYTIMRFAEYRRNLDSLLLLANRELATEIASELQRGIAVAEAYGYIDDVQRWRDSLHVLEEERFDARN